METTEKIVDSNCKANKNTKTPDAPAFLNKIIQDKKDIADAIKNKKSLADLAKKKGITFAKPL